MNDDNPDINQSTFKPNDIIYAGYKGAQKASPRVGLICEDKDTEPLKPLPSCKISPRFIRNTNATKCYQQEGGCCYAHAASSAYINTILQIYGAKPPPSYKDCFEVACYNGKEGGNAKDAIKKLEVASLFINKTI